MTVHMRMTCNHDFLDDSLILIPKQVVIMGQQTMTLITCMRRQ